MSSSILTAIFTAITDGLTTVPTAIVGAIKSLFMDFIYVDPAATTKALSDLAIFLLAFTGMSIGVGLVWLCISLFKRKK